MAGKLRREKLQSAQKGRKWQKKCIMVQYKDGLKGILSAFQEICLKS